ncbi:alpha/beta fold hydrolase, partial [Streptomyces sp. SID11233]|nr:alpha/beta fold hydrolase [Streptomyces sp. SID11233]
SKSLGPRRGGAGRTPVLHVAESSASPATAPPLVLIHGLAGSVAWWDPVLPALTGLRVLRFDLLGHGASPK